MAKGRMKELLDVILRLEQNPGMYVRYRTKTRMSFRLISQAFLVVSISAFFSGCAPGNSQSQSVSQCKYTYGCDVKKSPPKSFNECAPYYKDDLERKLSCWYEFEEKPKDEGPRSQPAPSQSFDSKDEKMDRAKSDCGKLFKVGTKDYGKCVMELLD